jgi:hypothetical protein
VNLFIAISVLMPFALAAQRTEYGKTHPPRESVGLIPLTDLQEGIYKGEQGGLYPAGENVPPPAHLKAGLAIAKTVVPLDADGKPAADGKIVLLSIGFSNPNLKFLAFKPEAEAYAGRNPHLLLINGCVGGQAAQVIADPKANYWKIVGQRISDAGATANQVQVIWMEQVIPGISGEFPAFAKRLQGYIEDSLHNAQARFPNLKLAYLSSRSYGGYSAVGGSPEPLAYETGFAVKWAIAGQIAGEPALNYDPAKGKVVAPWIAWGPYFWADGVKGRKDGLMLLRSDYRESDGLHPSEAGLSKFVKLLLDFFKTDATARIWFNR